MTRHICDKSDEESHNNDKSDLSAEPENRGVLLNAYGCKSIHGFKVKCSDCKARLGSNLVFLFINCDLGQAISTLICKLG